MSDEEKEPGFFSFEEYKLYYESTEKVIDRRLAANTWNYGLCSAIIIAIASLGGGAFPRPEFRLGTVAAIVFLAGMGSRLCVLWTAQIRDLKALNSAKFEVLNRMAPKVRFGTADMRVSAEPFATEWQILQANQTARAVTELGTEALGSTEAEFLVPMGFRRLFQFIIVAALIVTVLNLRSMIDTLSNTVPAATVQGTAPQTVTSGTKP